MPRMQQTTARLRLLLADIEAKGEQAQATVRQFRIQLDRLLQQAVYGRTSLEAALVIMEEIEERLAGAEALQRRLELLQSRVRRELEALRLLQRVNEARERLTALKTQVESVPQAPEEALAEVRRLEEFIAENSQQAGRTITTGR